MRFSVKLPIEISLRHKCTKSNCNGESSIIFLCIEVIGVFYRREHQHTSLWTVLRDTLINVSIEPSFSVGELIISLALFKSLFWHAYPWMNFEFLDWDFNRLSWDQWIILISFCWSRPYPNQINIKMQYLGSDPRSSPSEQWSNKRLLDPVASE